MFAHLYMSGMPMVASRGRDRGAAENGHSGLGEGETTQGSITYEFSCNSTFVFDMGHIKRQT